MRRLLLTSMLLGLALVPLPPAAASGCSEETGEDLACVGDQGDCAFVAAAGSRDDPADEAWNVGPRQAMVYDRERDCDHYGVASCDGNHCLYVAVLGSGRDGAPIESWEVLCECALDFLNLPDDLRDISLDDGGGDDGSG